MLMEINLPDWMLVIRAGFALGLVAINDITPYDEAPG